jgi:hypothetical protein
MLTPEVEAEMRQFVDNLRKMIQHEVSKALGSTAQPPSGEQERGSETYLKRVRQVATSFTNPSVPAGCISATFLLLSDVEYQTLIHTPVPATAPPEAATATPAPPNEEPRFRQFGQFELPQSTEPPPLIPRLRRTYQELFPSSVWDINDQAMIQRMAAEIQRLRTPKGGTYE